MVVVEEEEAVLQFKGRSLNSFWGLLKIRVGINTGSGAARENETGVLATYLPSTLSPHLSHYNFSMHDE